MSTGEIIKIFRDRMSLTQEDVSDFLNVSRELISYYENGQREIPLEQLERLADLFGVELEVFFTDNPQKINLEVAFAFRADSIEKDSLQQIADFRRIVLNYLKLNKISASYEHA
jgi:transcriptional regulator with XRE-family HTH domain